MTAVGMSSLGGKIFQSFKRRRSAQIISISMFRRIIAPEPPNGQERVDFASERLCPKMRHFKQEIVSTFVESRNLCISQHSSQLFITPPFVGRLFLSPLISWVHVSYCETGKMRDTLRVLKNRATRVRE